MGITHNIKANQLLYKFNVRHSHCFTHMHFVLHTRLSISGERISAASLIHHWKHCVNDDYFWHHLFYKALFVQHATQYNPDSKTDKFWTCLPVCFPTKCSFKLFPAFSVHAGIPYVTTIWTHNHQSAWMEPNFPLQTLHACVCVCVCVCVIKNIPGQWFKQKVQNLSHLNLQIL